MTERIHCWLYIMYTKRIYSKTVQVLNALATMTTVTGRSETENIVDDTGIQNVNEGGIEPRKVAGRYLRRDGTVHFFPITCSHIQNMLGVLSSADDDKLSGERWAIKTSKRVVRPSTRYDRDHVEDRVIVPLVCRAMDGHNTHVLAARETTSAECPSAAQANVFIHGSVLTAYFALDRYIAHPCGGVRRENIRACPAHLGGGCLEFWVSIDQCRWCQLAYRRCTSCGRSVVEGEIH